MELPREGWYTDPYELHDARWFSQGTPTALVRDAGTEGRDVPPEGAFKVDPVRWGEEDDEDYGEDLRRTGEGAEESPSDAAWDNLPGNIL